MKKTIVMGLAVNIASRIQESTKVVNNSFVVSDEVLAHSTLMTKGSEKMINLKGVSSPIRVHLLGKPYI
jgi:adenylate cyclase